MQLKEIRTTLVTLHLLHLGRHQHYNYLKWPWTTHYPLLFSVRRGQEKKFSKVLKLFLKSAAFFLQNSVLPVDNIEHLSQNLCSISNSVSEEFSVCNELLWEVRAGNALYGRTFCLQGTGENEDIISLTMLALCCGYLMVADRDRFLPFSLSRAVAADGARSISVQA